MGNYNTCAYLWKCNLTEIGQSAKIVEQVSGFYYIGDTELGKKDKYQIQKRQIPNKTSALVGKPFFEQKNRTGNFVFVLHVRDFVCEFVLYLSSWLALKC